MQILVESASTIAADKNRNAVSKALKASLLAALLNLNHNAADLARLNHCKMSGYDDEFSPSYWSP